VTIYACRKADTIPTDSVPTDAIPTVHRTTQYIFSTLKHVGIVEIGTKLDGVEASHASKHVIDPGSEVTEGSGVWGVGRVFR